MYSRFAGCLYGWSSNCGRFGSSDYLPVRYRFCRWSKARTSRQKKCWQSFKHCSSITLQQSHLLGLRYQYNIQSFLLPIVWYCLEQSTKFGASSDCLHWKSWTSVPKNVEQLRETLFDKLDLFGIFYTDSQRLLNNMAIFDFESISEEDEDFKYTKTTIWTEKHIPISVSLSSILIPETIFLGNPNHCDMVSTFNDALENLPTQSKTQVKMNFHQNETATNETCTYHRSTKSTLQSLCWYRRREQKIRKQLNIVFTNVEMSTDWLTGNFWDILHRLPVFGLNSARYNNNLVRGGFLLILVNEKGVEPIFIRKTMNFVSFNLILSENLTFWNFSRFY